MNNKTFRIFSIILYDNSDNLSFNDIFNNVLKNNLTYFYIKHSREDDFKKDHYHLSIYFDKPTTIHYLSNLLNISEHNINVLDEQNNRYTLKKTIGYLIHYNNSEKLQYKKEDIKTNRQDIVDKYYDILTGGNNEKNELREILAFINDNDSNISDTLSFCIECNYLKTFKKYSYVLSAISRYHY